MSIIKAIFERQNQKLKEAYRAKIIEIENLPSKKSNCEKAIKYFTKIAVNPSKFYESLEYNQKRVFQKLLFPEGLRYSIKNREYLTSKTGSLFELTGSFSVNYDLKNKRTYQENLDKSHTVPFTIKLSNHFIVDLKRLHYAYMLLTKKPQFPVAQF